MTILSHRAMKIALWAMVVAYAFLFAMAGWAFWGLVIDTRMPLREMQGRLISWNPINRTAVIEWSAVRQRFCEGLSNRQLRDGVVLDLEGASIPQSGTPDDRRWQAQTPGAADYTVTWQTIVGVPDIVRGHASYEVRIRYWCNPWQRLVPLELTPAPIIIPVGLPYDLGATEFG